MADESRDKILAVHNGRVVYLPGLPPGGWFMSAVCDPADFTYPAADDDCDPPVIVEGSR